MFVGAVLSLGYKAVLLRLPFRTWLSDDGFLELHDRRTEILPPVAWRKRFFATLYRHQLQCTIGKEGTVWKDGLLNAKTFNFSIVNTVASCGTSTLPSPAVGTFCPAAAFHPAGNIALSRTPQTFIYVPSCFGSGHLALTSSTVFPVREFPHVQTTYALWQGEDSTQLFFFLGWPLPYVIASWFSPSRNAQGQAP